MKQRSQTLKNVFFIVILVMILASCTDQSKPPARENVEETIIALEHQALDRWSDGDPLGYAANFAEDATYFDDIGGQMRIDSTAELQEYFSMLVGNVPKHHYELVDTKVQVYGDVAVLTAQYLGKSLEGEVFPPWKETTVYHFNDGKWQVVHANWSLVKMGQEEETAEVE